MRTAFFISSLLFCLAAHAQWQLQQSHTTADLRGIHSLPNGIAWASGTNGTVLHTENSGQTWQPCAIPPNAEHLDFRGIQAFDANTAIVMSSGKGDLSRLYKTTDACRTWKLVFTNPDKQGFWDAISGKDEASLIILGDPVNGAFKLFCRSPQSGGWGQCWKRERIASGKEESAFAASNSALLDEWDGGMIFFGTGGSDGGRVFTKCDPCTKHFIASWTPTLLPRFARGPSSGIFSIAGNSPGSASQLVSVGGDFSKPSTAGSAAFTSDRLHWISATTPPHGYRSSVAYSPTTKSWITVGPNGTDLSTDDGRNWRALRPSPREAPDSDRNWNALSLPFVVGPHGRIGLLRPEALTKQ